MARIAQKQLDMINNILFVGAGLWTLWYINNSIRVTSEEKQLLRELVQGSVTIRYKPELAQGLLDKLMVEQQGFTLPL